MNTYDIAPADVAAELPGLFPGGFTATSTPTDAKVQELIDEADTIVTLRITDDVGQSPALSDKAAAIAKRFIVNYVKAEVIRLIYIGRDPAYVTSIAQPFIDSAARLLEYIDALGTQAIGTGESSPAVTGHMTARPLVVESWDLDGQHGCSAYWRGDRGRY